MVQSMAMEQYSVYCIHCIIQHNMLYDTEYYTVVHMIQLLLYNSIVYNTTHDNSITCSTIVQ